MHASKEAWPLASGVTSSSASNAAHIWAAACVASRRNRSSLPDAYW